MINSLVHSIPSDDARDVKISMIRVTIADCLEVLMYLPMILISGKFFRRAAKLVSVCLVLKLVGML